MADIENRIQTLENKVADVDKNQVVLKEIINKFSENINRLSGVLDKFDLAIENLQISMIKMQGEISSSNKDIADIKSKLDCIDGDTKFNWAKFVNDKLIPILLTAGATYLIVKALGG